ncbi:Threonyl/alanyl tRNA synthetase [Panaeolus papilionaceus]|nr:Threonyl/alanyl tRNA synthetase [Panaeolus papilionaceus]
MATAILLPTQTPPDYFRIISPTLEVPSAPEISVPVGLLACQRDPLRKSIETTVVSVSVYQPPAAPAGKKTKKSVIAPDIPNETLLHVMLHDTVIFPEGGGQPTDTGVLTTEDQTTWEVVQCKRHGGHAVHYVKIPAGTDVDAGVLAFTTGAKIKASLDEAGYSRRYDHMSMHTSQHLLSALLETRLSLPTLSWSLTSYPSPCYVEIPRGMTQEEILSIQTEANNLVFEGRRVHVEVEELTERPAEATKLESGRSVGKALPEDYTGGVNRVVIIDGVDRNPCCGTHLPTIHNLQLFLVPHTEALSRSSATSARLYFLAGPRLINHLTQTHNFLANTSAILSCGPPLVPERVTQVVDERKKAEKRVSDTEAELAGYIARGLVDSIKSQPEGSFKKHIHRTDDTGNALGFLTSIAFALGAALADVEGNKDHVIVLSSSPSSQMTSSVSTVLVLGSDDAKVKVAGEGLRSKLGVKGGGKGPRWSGKFTGVWKENRENVVIDKVFLAL